MARVELLAPPTRGVRNLIWGAKERHSKKAVKSGTRWRGAARESAQGPPLGWLGLRGGREGAPGAGRWEDGRPCGPEGRSLVKVERPMKPALGSGERLGAEPGLRG